jgi:segregation and condensation protein B
MESIESSREEREEESSVAVPADETHAQADGDDSQAAPAAGESALRAESGEPEPAADGAGQFSVEGGKPEDVSGLQEAPEPSPSEQAGGDPLPSPEHAATPPEPVQCEDQTSTGAGEEIQEPATEPDEVTPEQLNLPGQQPSEQDDAKLKAVLEAIVYVTDEPLLLDQIAGALNQPVERVARVLEELVTEYEKAHHGLTIRQVAGGYRLTTKAEHHDAIRTFVRNLKPPLKLSLAALETLAVIAYKQPITAPEIMEVRGVQGAGVLKTLLDRKLITTAGRKQVIGKPILYKTTREFLVQFGLSSLSELPTLKEFEELRRMAFQDDVEMSPAEEAGAANESESGEQHSGTDAAAAEADAAQPEALATADSSEGPDRS